MKHNGRRIYSAERNGENMHEEIIPREVTSRVPRITLTGHERLHIEQHRGLIDYAPDNIVFRTFCGLLRIGGAGLRFSLYTAGEALVTGRIDSVIFQAKEART